MTFSQIQDYVNSESNKGKEFILLYVNSKFDKELLIVIRAIPSKLAMSLSAL